MSIKLIALDLDGTTLNKDGELSLENKAAIEIAIEKGVHVVIATGRCFDALPEEIIKIKGIRYAITSNGAQIRDFKKGIAIYNNCIDAKAIQSVYDLLVQYNHMIEIFVDGSAYMEASVYYQIKNNGISFRHRDYVVETRNPVEDVLGFMLKNRSGIENINIFFETKEEKEKMRPKLEQLKNVTMTTSLEANWELGGDSTSKATALHELNNILGVNKNEVMACGDSANDGAMLDLAGLPIAVGNAKEVIKKRAKFIARSNHENGVAQAINKFVIDSM